MKTRKLSDVPSKMLMQSLEDLKLVLRDPRFRINMDLWYAPRDTDFLADELTYCEVCHAGAVIAKSLGNGTFRKSPAEFEPDIGGKLYAINSFRAGELGSAFQALDIGLPQSLPLRNGDLLDSDGAQLFLGIDYLTELSGRIQVNKEHRDFYFNYFQDLIGILQAEGL